MAARVVHLKQDRSPVLEWHGGDPTVAATATVLCWLAGGGAFLLAKGAAWGPWVLGGFAAAGIYLNACAAG